MSTELDEDKYFAEELIAKRHTELTESLKKIGTLLVGIIQKDDKLTDTIVKQIESLEKCLSVANQPGDAALFTLLQAIKEGNERILMAIRNKPIIEEFKIQNTDNHGNKTVKVIYKNR